jgi:drug/metabolite transporter (DMT)-like permease
MKPNKYWIAAAFFIVYTVWGSTYIAIRFAIETMPPLLMAGARFLISGAILYAIAKFKKCEHPTGRHWVSAFWVGTLLLLGGNGSVAWAEQTVPSGMASVLIATVPLWMVLIGWMLNEGKKPNFFIFIGILLGFFGVWMLVRPGSSYLDPVGSAVLIGAAISWATGSILSRKLPLPASPILAIGMEMFAGGLMLLVAGFILGEHKGLHLAAISVNSWLAFIYLIVFGSFMGFTAYIWLLKVSTVAKVSTYAYVNPLVAVFLGVVIGGEAMTRQMFLAAFIILGGVILIQTVGQIGINPDS